MDAMTLTLSSFLLAGLLWASAQYLEKKRLERGAIKSGQIDDSVEEED